MLRAIALAAAVATAAATPLFAQVYPPEKDPYADAYIYDSDLDDTDMAAPAAVAPPARSTRVYGWTARRPADCGTFRYWNGERCADARVDPPND